MKRITQIILAIIILLALAVVPVWGANYYIDPASSGGDGTTTATSGATAAFATIAAAQAAVTGDQHDNSLLLKAGSVFREQFTVGAYGTAGPPAHPFTIGRYGTGVNPIIKRSNSWSTWWEEGLAGDGGFEVWTAGTNDSFLYSSLGFANGGGWYGNSNGVAIKADTSIYHPGTGTTSVKLVGSSGTRYSGTKPYLSQTFSITGADGTKTWTISAWGYRAAGADDNALFFKIKDNQATPKYLDAGGSWTTTANTACALDWAGSATGQWVEKTQVIRPDNGVSKLEISFYNYSASMASYVDDIVVKETTDTVKVWGAAVHGNTDYWGLVDNGNLINMYPASTPRLWRNSIDTTYSATCPIIDGWGSSPNANGMLLYRKDSGNPGTCEIGVRTNSILINNLNYINVTGVDTYGPGGSTANGRTDQFPESFTITGTSDHVNVSNSEMSFVDQGAIHSYQNATNITYTNLIAHDTAGTAIYNSSIGGGVYNCKAYNVGLTMQGGDRGGIGSYMGGNLTISGNEIYNIGSSTSTDCDFGISCVSPAHPMTITGNYIHDIMFGGIQVAAGGDSSTIANNIINNYGNTPIISPPNFHCSGIRIGGGVSGVLNATVYNNVIAYGKFVGATHAALSQAAGATTHDNSGLSVKNNIFYNNSCQDVYVYPSVTTTGQTFDHNDYYRVDHVNAWFWKTTNYSTLATWAAAAHAAEATITETGSITSDPLFVNASGLFNTVTDFRIPFNSPANGAGVDVGLTTDYWGNPIPNKAGQYPMGAYSYNLWPSNMGLGLRLNGRGGRR